MTIFDDMQFLFIDFYFIYLQVLAAHGFTRIFQLIIKKIFIYRVTFVIIFPKFVPR